MSNQTIFLNHLNNTFLEYKNDFNCKTSIKEASLDDSDKNNLVYLIDDTNFNSIEVISMDYVMKYGYKAFKNATTSFLPNSVDAFLIDNTNTWYFIEFKNSNIRNTKDNLEKKALNNLLMIIDILKHSKFNSLINFNYGDPLKFIKDNCVFIVVCPKEKNSSLYRIIKNSSLINTTYTPDFLEKMKQFYFKDSYVYTVELFKNKFLNNYKEC